MANATGSLGGLLLYSLSVSSVVPTYAPEKDGDDGLKDYWGTAIIYRGGDNISPAMGKGGGRLGGGRTGWIITVFRTTKYLQAAKKGDTQNTKQESVKMYHLRPTPPGVQNDRYSSPPRFILKIISINKV